MLAHAAIVEVTPQPGSNFSNTLGYQNEGASKPGNCPGGVSKFGSGHQAPALVQITTNCVSIFGNVPKVVVLAPSNRPPLKVNSASKNKNSYRWPPGNAQPNSRRVPELCRGLQACKGSQMWKSGLCEEWQSTRNHKNSINAAQKHGARLVLRPWLHPASKDGHFEPIFAQI